MDISCFSNDDFDTKAWVNDVLKNVENQKDGNSTMAMAMKLQLYVQQVNIALEETSQQVLASLPKIMRDTKSLHQEAQILKEKMALVREEIDKIEQDTGKSIKDIEKLDNVKNKLTAAKQGLHESDNWTVLVNEMEEAFDSKDVENISLKILGMQNSLKLLVDVSDYEQRKMQLEGLKNRLEAIASPAVVQVFSNNKTEEAQTFVRIFKSISRLPQLTKYYHKCQKDILLKKWRDQLEIEQDDSVVQWMHNYYGLLLSNWHTQYRWCNQVFANDTALETLINIYSDVLSSLDPSLNECIDAALKQVSDKLNFIGEAKETTKEFSDNLLKIIQQANHVKKYQLKTNLLLKAIFNHLIPYVSKYAAFEQAFLTKELSSLNCMKDELTDTIQALNLSVPSVIDICRDAKKRCKKITENCGYCGLLTALRSFLLSYGDLFRVALRQIERGRKSSAEDWPSFQLCLSLLQNTGEVLLQFQQLEKDLTSTVLDLNRKEIIVDYRDLLLDQSQRKEFDSLVKCVTEGTKLSLLDHVTTEFNKLCTDIHHTTYQVVFKPISMQLDVVQSNIWAQFANSSAHNSDLPDYSFSPQEYITQIGQYLLTLPQHLEPFLFRENPSLCCALKAVDQEYNDVTEGEGALASIFLKVVARGTCQGYCDRILAICELSHPASRQLAHDINYLNNVLDELGISLSENLQQLSLLLKLSADQYFTQSEGCAARLVAAVRQMRNIKSSN